MRIGKGKRNCFAQGRVEEGKGGRMEGWKRGWVEGWIGRLEEGGMEGGSRVRKVIVTINVNFGIS